MRTMLLLGIFALIGLGVGLGLTVSVYGYGYGYWQYIVWPGFLAYGLLGLLLGIWHGCLGVLRWELWKKMVLALPGSILLTIFVAVGEDMGLSHLSLLGSLEAAEIALTNKSIDVVIIGFAFLLLLCDLTRKRSAFMKLTTAWQWTVPSQIVFNCAVIVLIAVLVDQLLSWPTFWLWFLLLPLGALGSFTIWGWFTARHREEVLSDTSDLELLPELSQEMESEERQEQEEESVG